MSDLPFPSGDDHADLMREAWSSDEVAALRAELEKHRGFIEEMTQANDALTAELERVRAELNEAHRLAGEAQHRVELHRQTMERERAELERMRPVYNAAIQRHAGLCGAGTMVTIEQAEHKLKRLAVDAYRNSKGQA